MAIEKVIDIKIESNADEKILTLKQQLKAAKAEVIALSDAFGLTSQEAIHAAERAAGLTHEIANANKLVKTFNPSATLNSTTVALSSVKEGFEVAASTLNTFGFESKGLEGTLGKLGVAMELTQGVTAIQESAVAYQNLGATLKSYSIVQKLITAGQWLWNTAIMANPIGALVVVIAALIAAGVALVNYFKSSEEASAKNTAAVNANKKALDNQTKSLEKNASEFDRKQKQELAMAKASGMSAEAIRALELKLIDEKIAYEKSARAIAFNTYEKNKNYLASLKASGADEELIKKQTELTNESVKQVNKQNENLKKAFDEKKDIQNRHQVEIRQSQTNHNKEVADKNKEARTKAKDDADAAEKKKEEEEKAALKKIADDKLSADINSAKKAMEILNELNKKTETPAQKETREYEEKLAILRANNLSTEKLTKDHLDELKKIEDDIRLKADEKKAAELEKIANDSTATFDARREAIDAEQALLQKQLDDKVITEEQFNDKVKALSKSRLTIGELETQAKIEQAQRGAALLSNISDLIGKDTAAGKVAAIAATTINTYAAAQTAFFNAQKNPISILGPAYPYISAGLAIAGGLKNVQSILSVPTPGAGGGGGSIPSGGGAMTAPSFNTVGSSSTNQLAQTIGSQSQTPIKSYVVASDVSTAQALDRNIISNASI